MTGREVAKKSDEKPKPWRPNRKDFKEVADVKVRGQEVVSQPLRYGTLAQHEPETIRMIEAQAMVEIRQHFARMNLAVDETSLRPQWQLVIEGYAFPMPDGFVHPEAPPEEHAEKWEHWRRAVQGASDSIFKAIYCTVWRRRELPAPKPPTALGPGPSSRPPTLDTTD